MTTLHKTASVSEFVRQEQRFVDVLNNAHVIVMDDERIAGHPLTTDEIKECCKDVKVLGRKDLKVRGPVLGFFLFFFTHSSQLTGSQFL